jgi:hypothetical protein
MEKFKSIFGPMPPHKTGWSVTHGAGIEYSSHWFYLQRNKIEWVESPSKVQNFILEFGGFPMQWFTVKSPNIPKNAKNAI